MNTEDRNNRHLTGKEISQWLVEGPPSSASRHVQTCFACQAKLIEAQAPLSAFRSAVVEWSEAQSARPVNLQIPAARRESTWRQRLWLPAASFALAALLLFGYAKVLRLLHGNPSGQPPVATASTTPDADEALLDQVDTEVSEAVPDAMAPLTDLVSWDSSKRSAAQTTTRAKHVPSKTAAKPMTAAAPVEVTN